MSPGKLSKKGHNYKVYDNGTLEFSRIEKQDEADYKCKAKNLYGMSESDEVEVVVEAAAEIKEFPENTEVAEGEKLELQCAATGDPPPIISWLKNGQQVSFIIQPAVEFVINCLNLSLEFSSFCVTVMMR